MLKVMMKYFYNNNNSSSVLIQYDNDRLLHKLRRTQQAVTQDSTTKYRHGTQSRYNSTGKKLPQAALSGCNQPPHEAFNPVSIHHMAPPEQRSTYLINSLLLIYRPQKDDRLSWPRWLTYSGQFTHISGHPLAAGRAQDWDSSPANDHCAFNTRWHKINSIPYIYLDTMVTSSNGKQ